MSVLAGPLLWFDLDGFCIPHDLSVSHFQFSCYSSYCVLLKDHLTWTESYTQNSINSINWVSSGLIACVLTL